MLRKEVTEKDYEIFCQYIFSSILEVRVDKIDLSLHERKIYGKVISIGEIFTSVLVLYYIDIKSS